MDLSRRGASRGSATAPRRGTAPHCGHAHARQHAHTHKHNMFYGDFWRQIPDISAPNDVVNPTPNNHNKNLLYWYVCTSPTFFTDNLVTS